MKIQLTEKIFNLINEDTKLTNALRETLLVFGTAITLKSSKEIWLFTQTDRSAISKRNYKTCLDYFISNGIIEEVNSENKNRREFKEYKYNGEKEDNIVEINLKTKYAINGYINYALKVTKQKSKKLRLFTKTPKKVVLKKHVKPIIESKEIKQDEITLTYSNSLSSVNEEEYNLLLDDAEDELFDINKSIFFQERMENEVEDFLKQMNEEEQNDENKNY